MIFLRNLLAFFSALSLITVISAQSARISGRITHNGSGLPLVNIGIPGTAYGNASNDSGYYEIREIPPGHYSIKASAVGYESQEIPVRLKAGEHLQINIRMEESGVSSDDVVISGTLSPVSREKSPVAIEVYRPAFFLNNPTPSLFESLQIINGVRPQVNCNICNTGDIHINGLEGPYTMITIDGMPIVSGLATVYGLQGIPNSLVDRIEIIRGPASTLYGSEAVGGLINVVTKDPGKAPRFSLDYLTNSWGEQNLDLGDLYKTGRVQHLAGINLYYCQWGRDNNADGFTDMSLAKRVSLFHKSAWKQKAGAASLAFRIVSEDRWGGQMNWNERFRASDSIYGENIKTRRLELIGQVPFRIGSETFRWQLSSSWHDQDSWYGKMTYLGNQNILFNQLFWSRKLSLRHQMSAGAALRYTYYDDNTPATMSGNATVLPGLFVQDEFQMRSNQSLLAGIRFDYHAQHGPVFSPRLNYKLDLARQQKIRIGIGNGFRVANVFTEDHAALTGAREVVFTENLRPEESWNINVNYQKFISLKKGFLQLEVVTFYTHFTNRILPDYESNPNQIIYSNLNGFSVSRGISFNVDGQSGQHWTWQSGVTWMDVSTTGPDENGTWHTNQQWFTERLSGTWNLSYHIGNKKQFRLDYTGNVYSPMRLPLLGPLDTRSPNSPWFSIQNIQFTWSGPQHFELYAGIKNLLNFTPPANSIARAHDPFDKNVQFDAAGNPVATPENPQALTFDPTYVYTSNQGIRFFGGIRWKLP